jgi:hypothetical protein
MELLEVSVVAPSIRTARSVVKRAAGIWLGISFMVDR